MKRDLAALEDRKFDLAVVGAGVVGASIARDAARRGLAVALIDKDDFGAATSEAMSHMVHGGIRYLARGEFGQARLSLAERTVWRRIAPHQVSLLPCLAPLAGGFSHDLGLGACVAHAADVEMALTPQDIARRLARWYAIRHPGVVERASVWLAGRRKVTDAGS